MENMNLEETKEVVGPESAKLKWQAPELTEISVASETEGATYTPTLGDGSASYTS